MESNSFLVGISCMTYNHRNYIVDAMNGFTMQQTNFPFVAVIVDDASTDGEPEVINNYLDEHFDQSPLSKTHNWENEEARYVFVQHKENKNCYFAVVFLKTNYYSQKKSKKIHTDLWLSGVKYIAFCEGDDYWINPDKLQKQVDFLEIHIEYSLCFHSAIEHWEDGSKEDNLFAEIDNRDYTGLEIFQNWKIATASVVIKRNVLESDIYLKSITYSKMRVFGDLQIFLSSALCGKIRGISSVMSVYRRHSGGVTFKFGCWQTQTKLAYQYLEVYKVFGKEYKKTAEELFFFHGIRAFFVSRNAGAADYKLLLNLIEVAPVKTLMAVLDKIKVKISHK